MSRVCVKGVPPFATEDHLRKHFAEVGDITDVKIARTKDGKSRQFAFIGFRQDGAGPAAVARFNKTFLNTARLTVEEAREIGDNPVLKRAWGAGSTPAAGAGKAAPSASVAAGRPTAAAALAATVKNQERLAEFLALSRKAGGSATWANDDDAAGTKGGAAVPGKGASAAGGSKAGAAGAAADSDDEYQELPSATKSGAKAPTSSSSGGGDASLAASKGLSDLAYLRARAVVKKDLDDEDDEGEQDEEEGEEEGKEKKGSGSATKKGKEAASAPAPSAPAPAPAVDPMAVLGDTGRLFIRNLPFTVTEDDLKARFSKHGLLAEVHLPLDSAGKRKGFAYVTFAIPEQAVVALAAEDGKSFQGRLMHVLPAKPAANDAALDAEPSASGPGSSSYKRKKEEERRAGAGSAHEVQNVWNTLFLRSDAAISAAAERLGVSRSEVLAAGKDSKEEAGGGPSMAVRAALAETAVIAETRDWLTEQGVALEALEAGLAASAAAPGTGAKAAAASSSAPSIKRSDTTILVKNLPFDAEAGEVRDLFARFGVTSRVVMPPSRVLALVEFTDPKAAKRAFASLAYTRFRRVPLYLEWAPEAVFGAAPAPAAAPVPVEEDASAGKAGKKRGRAEMEAASAAPAPVPAAATAAAEAPVDPAAEPDLASGSTLYVKNVSFNTNDDALRKLFATVGPLRAVRIPHRRNPKWSAGSALPEWLSLGYGFVEFVSRDDAMTALKTLQGRDLDGHALNLKIATAGPAAGSGGEPPAKKRKTEAASAATSTAAAAAPTPDASASSTKLLVRNLAFEATRAELKELFSPFGQVKTVRIPRKAGGQHRGFAFIEFLTHAEAVAAKDALASTHLYGRHLVLEWAAAEEAVGEGQE